MTFSQRITCMLICLLMGSISFVYAFTSLFSALFSPTKFILPYVFSNIMFFTMVGFFRGFKTYYRSLFTRQRRRYTTLFLGSTVFTVFSCYFIRFYLLNLVLIFAQMISFCVFAVTFL